MNWITLNSQSNRNADRFLPQLREYNSDLIKLWTDIQQKIETQSQVTPPGTPSSVPPSWEQKAALNPTSAAKKIHTRLQSEESTEILDSSYIVGQALTPRKQKTVVK